LDGQDVTYISTPRIIIDENYLMQGHHLKYNDTGDLVFYFLGYTNEIQLPNLDLHLYKSSELTFTLVEQEEAHTSSVSRRSTRSKTRNKSMWLPSTTANTNTTSAFDTHDGIAPLHADT
jgi:hypothetical protein